MQRKKVIIFLISLIPTLLGFSAASAPVASNPIIGAINSNPKSIASPISVNNFDRQLSGLIQPTFNITSYLPIILKPLPPVSPPVVLEPFENALEIWQVSSETSGSGSIIQQSNAQAAAGTYSARVATSSSNGRAQIWVKFSDAASKHVWGERSGSYFWQWANIYLPSATVAQLGANNYITVAGFWPTNSSAAGWWLRVRQEGQLYVFGYDQDGNAREFQVYGVFPQDQWVNLELGLHSQSGPGVKRAFAFLIKGDFFGWYHQGHMVSETFDRAAMGIISTNSNAALQLYIDQWRVANSNQFPGGPDNRSTANLQEQNYRTQSGEQWQIDWSTWGNELQLDPQYGLFSASNRLQSGRNLDRIPDLTDGWAEIEIDWPNGTPPTEPNNFFGPMVALRKEINREENLEVVPVGDGNGNINLVFEAWVGFPVVITQWPLPVATTIGGGSHIPEPGDIIRARWEQVTPTNINIRASYYDASTNMWHKDILNHTFKAASISGGAFGPVNYNDGYHLASSVTIDSPYYSIRRYKVGTLDTYPQ